jgi:hypothetical protein
MDSVPSNLGRGEGDFRVTSLLNRDAPHLDPLTRSGGRDDTWHTPRIINILS